MSAGPIFGGLEEDGDRTLLRRPNALDAPPEAPEDVVHLLRVHGGGLAASPPPPIRLAAGGFTVGRTEGADLVLPGAEISRRHCRLDIVGTEVLAGGEVLLTDLGSTNGTFVDGTRILQPVVLASGNRVTVGPYALHYERRGRRDAEEAEALARELAQANRYVLAILPMPLRDGPVRAESIFVPSSRLGGDAFGYRELSPGLFAGYILDVAGHGVAAAMYSVSIANLLRQDGPLGADLAYPAAVVERLAASFPMERQDGLFFTIWYWVYDVAARTLTYCAGGHHPATLLLPDRVRSVELAARNPAVGLLAGHRYAAEQVGVPPGSALYMFSDGATEFEDRSGRRRTIEDFLAVIRAPAVETLTEPQRLYEAVRAAAQPGPLEDDFSVVVVTFA
jgi:serine phosphatase RsbU (regulator of sigma subunit)